MKEGWKEVRLGDITEKLPKSNHPAKDALESGDYLFFTNSASEKKFYINDYDYDEPIILANTGGRAYFKYCDTKCSASRDLYIIRCTENINTKLIYYILMQRVEEINENGFAGAALKHLNKHYLNDLNIMIPESREEQDKLVNLFDSLGDLVEAHSAKADVLSRMKEHLMDNKSGIIKKERNRSVFDADLIRLQDEIKKNIHIDFDRLNSTNLDAQIKFYKDNVDKIVHTIRVITYIGEDKQYEREREREFNS